MFKKIAVNADLLKHPYQEVDFVSQSLLKKGAYYLYFENVIVPANYRLQISESLFFSNIGGAVLTADIRPAMLKNIAQDENLVAELIAVLKMQPIVVATEIVYSSDGTPNELTDEKYDRNEIVRFIGVVTEVNTTIDYNNGQTIISVRAIDLLNYLLTTSSLYLFGERGAISGIQASTSFVAPILQEIVLPLLSSENNYGKVLGGLLSLIGLKRKTEISEKEKEELEKQIKDVSTPMEEVKDADLLLKLRGNSCNLSKDAAKRLLQKLSNDDFIYKILSDPANIGAEPPRCATPAGIYEALTKPFGLKNLIPCSSSECSQKEEKSFDSSLITDEEQIKKKLYSLALRAFFFDGSDTTFYSPNRNAVYYAYRVQDYEDFNELYQEFKDFLNFAFKQNVEFASSGTTETGEKLQAPSEMRELLKRARKTGERYRNIVAPKKEGEESGVVFTNSILSSLYLALSEKYKTLTKNSSGLPSFDKVILATLAKENSPDYTINYTGAGTSAQIMFRIFLAGSSREAFMLRRALSNSQQYSYGNRTAVDFIKQHAGTIFPTSLKNVPNLEEWIVRNSPSLYGAKTGTMPYCLFNDFVKETGMHGIKADTWIKALSGDNAAINAIKKFTQKRIEYKKGGRKALEACRQNKECCSSSSIGDDEIRLDNLFAFLYALMPQEQRKEFDFVATGMAIIETMNALKSVCKDTPIDMETIAMAYYAGARRACSLARDKEKCKKNKINKDTCQYGARAKALAKIFERDLDAYAQTLTQIDFSALRKFVNSPKVWDNFVGFALQRLEEDLQKFVPRANAVVPLDAIYDIDTPKKKYNVDEYLWHGVSRMRDFMLKSILVPISISNWMVLSQAIRGSLFAPQEGQYNVGVLVNTFLQMTKTRIIPVPPMLIEDEDENWRIALYAAIPALDIPPIPSARGETFVIEPVSNRFMQDTLAASASFFDQYGKPTTLYITMSVAGAPMLVTIPLSKVLSNPEKMELSDYINYYARVVNESPIEKVLPPNFSFTDGGDIISQAMLFRNLTSVDTEEFSEFAWMFLAYLMMVPGYWAMWSGSRFDIVVPSWLNSIVGFPFRMLTLASGNFIAILNSVVTDLQARNATTSFYLRNIYHIESQQAMIPYLDPAYPSDLVLVDMFFKATDYYTMSSISRLFDAAMRQEDIYSAAEDKIMQSLKEVGYKRARLLNATSLMGKEFTEDLSSLQPETRKEMEIMRRADYSVLPENMYNIRLGLFWKLGKIYAYSNEIGVSALYYDERLRSIAQEERIAGASNEAAIFKNSLQSVFDAVIGKAHTAPSKEIEGPPQKAEDLFVRESKKWRPSNAGRIGPLSIKRTRAF